MKIRFFLDEVTNDYLLIWPIHPRTKQKLIDFNLWDQILICKKMIVLNPLSYHEMLKLNLESSIMFTDSGGLQEECTILGTPCLTLRYNTERPITLCENGGASILTGNKKSRRIFLYAEIAISAELFENGYSEIAIFEQL